jgi:transposase
MLGKTTPKNMLFHYFNMYELIPEDNILKLVNKFIDFSFIRKKTKHLYSNKGRPSIDPELLLKMLLIGYLEGITSERKLCQQVNLNIAYRWFLGLDIEDPVPNHSTFSKNRHGRFKESGLFQETFNEIVIQCIKIGLVDGKEVTVDGSLIKANASKDSMKPIIDLNYTPETFIEMLDKENMLNDPSFFKKN